MTLKLFSKLSYEDFPALRDIMMNMTIVFGLSYIFCEKIFLWMKQTKYGP